MQSILITGVSGYIGSKLCCLLDQSPEVGKIIGIDIKPPANKPEKLQFFKHDIRQSLAPIISGQKIDAVVHAAYVLPPLHNQALMEDININGTRNLLESCREFGVSNILYLSSATAYGFYADNENPLVETSPLRGNEDFTYANCKRILEGIIEEFANRNPDIPVTVLRPCNVVGPGFDNPISHYFESKIVLLPKENMPFQFVHEDDLMAIMKLFLDKPISGAFNVGAQGTLEAKRIVRMLGNIPICLPYRLLYWLNHIAWILRLKFITEFPSPAMEMIRHSWVVSSEKLRDETGYRYRYNSLEAFETYAKSFKEQKQGN